MPFATAVLFCAAVVAQSKPAGKYADADADRRRAELVRALADGTLTNTPEEAAKRLRTALGPQRSPTTGGHWIAGRQVLWYVEAPPPGPVQVLLQSARRRFDMKRLGSSNLWQATWKIDGSAYEDRYRILVAGREVGGGQFRIEHFPLGIDSLPQPAVAKGTLRKMPPHLSRIYPGTVRDWWVYLPARPAPAAGHPSMVFQDGRSYALGEGNVCTVLDNLISQGKLPAIVAVFVNPGVDTGANGVKRPPAVSRSEEYDTCTPKYANYLEKEILPEVEKLARLSKQPAQRAICGISSGGSCAFSAAWHRPDMFGRVLSHVGSFCDFRQLASFPTPDGRNPPRVDDYRTWQVAHNYPGLIRKTPPKPLRVFLQDGSRDLNNSHGSWPLANQQMAAALAFAGYKHRFAYGDGFHSLAHGKAIMPEALTWLWSDD